MRKVIRPALAEGAVVLSDRFHDSTTVYQGIVRGLDPKLVASAHRMAVGDCVPQLTLLLVLPVAEGRRRMMRRVRPVGGEADPHAPHHRAARGAADIELTERERDVLRLVAQGHDNRMICGELFLAEVTVKKHIQRSMAKLGVTSRTQLLLAAMSLGLGR